MQNFFGVTQKRLKESEMDEGKLLKISKLCKFEVRGLLPDKTCADRLAAYFQNFSDQTRIRILSALSVKELCVNDLSNVLEQNQTTVSHQLKSLKEQGVIDCRRDGKILTYYVKSQAVNEIMLYALKELG
jgi:DNA-binding transcriptional ArsR family regulator